MSTSAISSSLLAQIAGSSSTANQFLTGLNQLAEDLQSGNLSAAQQDFVTLSQDALDGATSSTATTSASGITASLLSDIASSPSTLNAFDNDLNQLGTDLGNGNLSSAQQDLLNLDSTALNAASSSSSSSPAASKTSSTATANQADIQALVKATVEAMATGDNSAVSTTLSLLASISPSSQGATVLEQESASFGSNSSSASSSGSISQLLSGLESSNSDSLLNEIV